MKVIELLPWFVNGTLKGEEQRFIRQHLRICLPCRGALQEQQRLADLVRNRPTVHPQTQRGFEELMLRAEARFSVPGTGRPTGRTVRLVSLALAATVLVAVTGIGAYVMLVRPDLSAGPAFMTLSSDSSADEEIRLDIVFAGGVSEAEMESIVKSTGGAIVDGPSDVGRYSIRLPNAASSDKDLDNIVAQLRNDERVRFVGLSFLDSEPR